MFSSKFSFTIFLQIFFLLFSKVFTNISKIYELPKINNIIPKYCQSLVLTIVKYQAIFMSQLHLASELYPYNFFENVLLGAKYSFGRVFFQKSLVPKDSFFVASDVVHILYNKPYVLEINIFGRYYSNLNNLFQRY